MQTHWKKLNNPEYIGAYELLGVCAELKVKIKTVSQKEVKGADGSKKLCIVADLENQKPLILNATNCKIISKVYGTSFIEDWNGKEIILIVSQVKAFGDVVDALRIKPIKPEKEKLTISHPSFEAAKKSIQTGAAKMDQIKKKYEVSAEVEKLLTQKS
jgi:hypothetical protein